MKIYLGDPLRPPLSTGYLIPDIAGGPPSIQTSPTHPRPEKTAEILTFDYAVPCSPVR